MPLLFRKETRATLRRRVGSLLDPGHFQYGQVLAASSTTVTVQFAKRLSDGYLKGRVLYVVSGTGAGQAGNITDSAAGTGVITITPAFTVTPDTTSWVEVWSDELDPERVNDALNLAVIEAGQLQPVFESLSLDPSVPPTIAADLVNVTPPENWVYVTDLIYLENVGIWRKYYPARFVDYPYETDLSFVVVDGLLVLTPPMPASVAVEDIRIRGYRLPTELTSDSIEAEVPADYLVYAAALALDSGRVSGPALDPEAHAQRANAWTRAMLVARSKLSVDWEPNTVRLV